MVQSVLLFLFFWQGSDDIPVRDLRGLSRSKARQDEQEIEKHLDPIEKTIELLSNKINALNATFDTTVTGQKGSKPTETLRVKLRSCISQITAVLAEIDQLGQPTVEVTDFTKIDEERRNLSAKRRILQQRLSPDKVTVTENQKISEVVSAISAVVAKQPELAPLESNSSLSNKRGREFVEAASLGHIDTDGRQYKKSKSVGRNNPFNTGIHHANPSLKSLIDRDHSTDTSSYTSSEYSTTTEDEAYPPLPSLSLGLVGLGDDLLAGLNKFGANTAQSGSGSGSGSSSDYSDSEDDSSASDPSPSKAPKPLAEPLSFGLGDTTSLLNALAGFKKEPTKDTPKSPSSKPSKTASKPTKTAATKVSEKPLPDQDDSQFDFSQIQGRGKGRMMAKMGVLPPPAKTKDTKPSQTATKPSQTATKDKKPSPSPLGSKDKPSNAPPTKKPSSRPNTIVSDVDGGDTFALFRKMNELAKKNDPTQVDSEESSASSWSDDPKEKKEPVDLIASHGFKEDMNKEGMRRGKKGNNLAPTKAGGKAAPRYQQEDTHLELYPFLKNKNMALFSVFDGHAGKECSTALLKEFPAVFKKHWNAGWEEKTDLTDLWKIVYQETDNNLKRFEYEGATSTTVLVWRCSANGKRYAQSANLGDSTSYLLRKGKAVIMSQDHKPTIASERDRITAMGIKLEPGQSRLNGLAVSRAFGDHFPKDIGAGIISEPYVSESFELTPADGRIIVASDGLWDILSAEEAFNSIKSTKDPSQAARKLVKQAVSARDCHDNVTAIVVNLI